MTGGDQRARACGQERDAQLAVLGLAQNADAHAVPLLALRYAAEDSARTVRLWGDRNSAPGTFARAYQTGRELRPLCTISRSAPSATRETYKRLSDSLPRDDT